MMGVQALIPALPAGDQNDLYSQIQMPKTMLYHKYIGKVIMPWLNLHYPVDSSFNSRIFIARKKNGKMCTVTRRNIGEVSYFVPHMHISENCDYYISANGVKGVARKKRDLFSLHNIVVDIDCHEQDVPYELYARELVARSRRDLFDCGAVPEPNSIVYTGRGVQFWWALEATSKALLHVYQRAQSWMLYQFDQLIEEYPSMLSDLAVDAAASRNVVGYFRLPMTYNTAIHKKSSFALLHTKRYKLTDLVEQFVPKDFSEKAYTRKQIQSQAASVSAKNSSIEISANDVAVFEGGTNAMARRVLKMVELRALRNALKGKETRDLLCFVVYCALLSIHEQDEAWGRLLAFNKGFKQPMMTEELEEVMAAAQRNRYHLTNEWIIEKLEITTQEQQAIDLYVCEAREKRGSNYSRDLLRWKKKEARNTEILSLFSKGKNQSEIAEEMHLSRNTVAKVLKAANVLSPKKQKPAEAQLLIKNDVEEDIDENVPPETGAQKLIILKKEQKWACSNSVRKLRVVSYRGTHRGKTTECPTVKIHPHSRGRPPT